MNADKGNEFLTLCISAAASYIQNDDALITALIESLKTSQAIRGREKGVAIQQGGSALKVSLEQKEQTINLQCTASASMPRPEEAWKNYAIAAAFEGWTQLIALLVRKTDQPEVQVKTW